MSALPNTLIIGVQKSATSWLAARLSQHPDIFVVPGEVHYFDEERNYSRGAAWYQSFFKNAGAAKIRCEKSGAYFWTNCEGVPGEPMDKPERIKALLPDVKMIIVLRDPVARAYSAWNHMVRGGRIRDRGPAPNFFDPKLAEEIRDHGILTRGLYHAQLQRFLEVFPREQILILMQEVDVIAKPANGLEKACRFLDVDPAFSFDMLTEVENRFKGTRLGNRLSVPLTGPLHEIAHRIDRYILTRLPIARLPYPKGDAGTRAAVGDYYEEDARKLSELIGPLPDNWLGGRLAS